STGGARAVPLNTSILNFEDRWALIPRTPPVLAVAVDLAVRIVGAHVEAPQGLLYCRAGVQAGLDGDGVFVKDFGTRVALGGACATEAIPPRRSQRRRSLKEHCNWRPPCRWSRDLAGA